MTTICLKTLLVTNTSLRSLKCKRAMSTTFQKSWRMSVRNHIRISGRLVVQESQNHICIYEKWIQAAYHVTEAKHHAVTRSASWKNPAQQIPREDKPHRKLYLLRNQLQPRQAKLVCYCVNWVRCLLSGNRDHNICSEKPLGEEDPENIIDKQTDEKQRTNLYVGKPHMTDKCYAYGNPKYII